MTIRAALALAAALSVGCGDINTALDWGSPASSTTLEAADRAQQRWYDATGRSMVPPYIRETSEAFLELDSAAVGKYVAPGLVYVSTAYGPGGTETILLHEFGHHLGIGHAAPPTVAGAPRPVMVWANAGYCLTRRDVELACLAGPCQWEEPECE